MNSNTASRARSFAAPCAPSSTPRSPSATSATAARAPARYRVEPNIKDGKGGLRDLHTLHWLAKYLHGEEYGHSIGEDAISAGIFTKDEVATFRRCEDFLWTVRCHLHFLTGRPEERLSFDVQPVMAERLGYKSHARLARGRALHEALLPDRQGCR